MLYLAETQRKSGFIGSGKAEFKLLACQRSEHDWSAVPGDEVIAAPDDAAYGADTLVMLEINSSRQIQRHQEAGRTLVSILQSFSSLSKKFKAQGEEIEQWKESLTYQSQALNRREMEIESRQDEIDQAEANAETIEAQRQAVEAQKGDIERQQEELTRKNSELEGAWAHLNGELQRFEERQADATGGLSHEQRDQLRGAISHLTQTTVTTESASEALTTAFELVTHYQAELTQNEQILGQKQADMAAGQKALSAQGETFNQAKRSLIETEALLTATQAHLQQQQALLGAKQEQNQLLTDQLKNQTDLHQQVYELLNAVDKVKLSKKVDVAALEAMSESDLQTLVTTLEQDLDKLSRFVHDQEEELKLKQEDIDAIQAKMEHANEYDRLQLETEIAEEKDHHVMLNRTLVGQRRNLLEREEVLSQHQAILRRRQGLTVEGTGAAAAELEPIMDEIDELRAQLGNQIQQVETDSARIHNEIDTLKQTRQQQQESLDAQKQAASAAETSYVAQQQTLYEAQGQVTVYESLLSTMAERLGGLQQKLEAVSATVEQIQAAAAQQQQAIADTQQIVHTLGMAEPDLV